MRWGPGDICRGGRLGASVRHWEGDTQAPEDGDMQPRGLAVVSGVSSTLPSRVPIHTLTAAGLCYLLGPTQQLLWCARQGNINAKLPSPTCSLLHNMHCSRFPMMASCCDLHSFPEQVTKAGTSTCMPGSCQHEYSHTEPCLLRAGAHLSPPAGSSL